MTLSGRGTSAGLHDAMPAPVVHVVDDDESMRDSLMATLEGPGHETRIHASGAEFLDAVEPGRPGCAILDVRMPGMTGLEVQKQLVERGVDLPLVFITGFAEVPLAVEAMRAGAIDFLQKPFRAEELVDRVNAALDISREAWAAGRRKLDIRGRMESLTAREREVLDLVVAGQQNKDVAEVLGISRRTVEVHRNRVMAKMGAANVVDLVTLVHNATD